MYVTRWHSPSDPGMWVTCNAAGEEVDEVGRCRLTVSKPVLKAPMVSTLESMIQ
jgi:hypothetical protein